MADVQIQQTPDAGSGGGGSGLVWGIVVIILLAVIAWFVWGGGLHKTSTTKVDINVPGVSGGTGGGAPSGGAPSGGAKKGP